MKAFVAPALVLTLSALSAVAQAALPFTHPAVRSEPAARAAQQQALVERLEKVGHPASPQWVVAHANHEHPAVAAARAAAAGHTLDANHFLVQPPATTQWTLAPATAAEQLAAEQAPAGR